MNFCYRRSISWIKDNNLSKINVVFLLLNLHSELAFMTPKTYLVSARKPSVVRQYTIKVNLLTDRTFNFPFFPAIGRYKHKAETL